MPYSQGNSSQSAQAPKLWTLSRFRNNRCGIAMLILLQLLATSPLSAQGPVPPQGKVTSKDFGKRQNRLARESSPYLRSHASNPVDWYPWGPEALQKAMAENKPIFLSVGYSTCFWCHVMERQVFENEEIAAYMNEHFINIKVDREERPDIDDVYMTALQVYFQLAKSSQGGGWPLSIFLTPDAKPIAGGTYFPPEDRPGMIGFPTVLKQIHNAWTTRERDVRNTAEIITREVARLTTPARVKEPIPLQQSLIDNVIQVILNQYDPEHGGFDFDASSPDGPKFPVPCKLMLLQSQVGRDQTGAVEDPAPKIDHTLSAMAAGGLWDHLGGGFHRYSTDRRWHVPHFEKMLYDNAMLAEVYLEAWRRTGREQYRQTAEAIFEFVKRDLTDPNGAFYSALDAETDGVEGLYYVWSKEELEQTFSAANLRIFAAAYGTDSPSPFPHGCVLHLPRPLSEVADELRMPVQELTMRLAEMRKQLLARRNARPALLKDDKILTSWNGLMIRAYARAGQLLKRQDYLDAASKAALFLLTEHRDASGGLLRRDAEKPEQQPAFLDDYAFFVSGLLALHEATREEKWLNAAKRLTDEQIGGFWDQEQGGFYYSSTRQEVVLTRLKSGFDSEIPSANGVSVQNLVRLARLKSDDSYREYAQRTLMAFANQMKEHPAQSAAMAMGLQEYLHWYGSPPVQAAGQGLFSGGLSSPPAFPTRPQSMPSTPPTSPEGSNTPIPPGTPRTEVVPHLIPDPALPAVPHVQAKGYLNTSRLVRGRDCRVAIELTMEPGWHINANPARPDFVIPLTITADGSAGVELVEIDYPKGINLEVEGIETPLSVYEGTVLVTGTLRIPDGAPEVLDLRLKLKLQTCNNQTCLPPRQLLLQGRIPVTDSPAESEPVNHAIFSQQSPTKMAPNSSRAVP